jgi:hypothetical protein
VSVSVLYMSMSLDGTSPATTTSSTTPSVTMGSGCTIGSSLRTVSSSRVELDIIRVIDTPEATHIRYRVPR